MSVTVQALLLIAYTCLVYCMCLKNDTCFHIPFSAIEPLNLKITAGEKNSLDL